MYTPTELQHWGTALVELLDQTVSSPTMPAPGPGERAVPAPGSGRTGAGKLKGRFDDAAMFDAIAAVIAAHARSR